MYSKIHADRKLKFRLDRNFIMIHQISLQDYKLWGEFFKNAVIHNMTNKTGNYGSNDVEKVNRLAK